jgi:DNA-binding beta-propeller fold protein YncE
MHRVWAGVVGAVLVSATVISGPMAGAAGAPGTRIEDSACLDQLAGPDLGPQGAYGIGIDPVDATVYVAVDGEGRVDVLSPVTHAVVNSIPVPDPTVGFVEVDRAHEVIWVGSFSADAVYAIDLGTELPVATIPVTSPQSLALNPITNRLYVAGQGNDTVEVVDTVTRTSVGTLDVGGSSLGVEVDPTTNRVFVGDYSNGTLDVFGGADGLLDDTYPVGDEPITVAFDPVTGNAWVTSREPGSVVEVDPDTGPTGLTVPYADAQGLAVAPASRLGFVTESGGNLTRAFELVDGSPVETFLTGGDGLVVEARENPLRVYASSLDDGTVTVIGAGTGPFSDVTGSHLFCRDIDWLVRGGITAGFSDGTYRPTAAVTRQSMAAFLYRFAGEPSFTPPPKGTFPDVGKKHDFFLEIEWMNAEGIGGGFPDGKFRPAQPVTRQSMAAFLYRFAGEPAFTPPGSASFTDVPRSHPFFLEVEWLASTGITSGFADGRFAPGASVTRASMAAFLRRFDRVEI